MEKLLQISSGRGPAECCWVVAQVLKLLIEEAKNEGIQHLVIDRQKGSENGTLISAVIQLNAKELDPFLLNWTGTIQWIGQSPYRKHHKRKNWFVGIQEIQLNDDRFQLQDKDLVFEAIRAGGPGGQHVNKVSTAVRVKHKPSGLFVLVSDSRSQSQNKKKAKERLAQLLQIKEMEAKGEQARSNWKQHTQLQRGNPVRVFKGSDFKKVTKSKSYKQKRQELKRTLKRNMET